MQSHDFLPAVYILTNRYHGVLYIGVTSRPVVRIAQHRAGIIAGFTAKYHCTGWFILSHLRICSMRSLGRNN